MGPDEPPPDARHAPRESPPADPVRVPPRRHGPWRIRFFSAVERAVAALGGRALYRRRHLAPGRFLVRREVVAVPDLDARLEGLRVAHLSDLHAGRFLGAGDLRHVVDAVRALDPHLVVFTGDLITHHWSEGLTLLDDLARLEAPLGFLGVFGNHDYKGRQEGRLVEAFGARGLRFLRNEGARLGDLPLVVTGLEDPEEARELDLARARRDLRPGDLELCLCHNPAAAPALAREGCAAVLTGHTHGTQVDLPGLRGLGPAHPGLRVQLGPTTLVVSRGLGVVGVPLRVGAPAEVVLVELRRA